MDHDEVNRQRTPKEDEIAWECWRPRDYGNRKMGDRPVTHLVMFGKHVPEWHVWRTVDTRKGDIPRPPAYQAIRPKRYGIQPKPFTPNVVVEVDWAAVAALLTKE